MTDEASTDGGLLNGDASWIKLVLVLLLSGSTVGSGVSLYGSRNTVTHSELDAALALVAERHAGQQRELDNLQRQVNRIDDTHPPPELVDRLTDALQRIREAERRLDKAGIGE